MIQPLIIQSHIFPLERSGKAAEPGGHRVEEAESFMREKDNLVTWTRKQVTELQLTRAKLRHQR